jgi:SAM-dependent methyltransferase
MVTQPARIATLQADVLRGHALLAGMQLDVFTALGGGGASVAEVAQRLGVSEQKLAPLLYALVVAGLVEHHEGRFVNTAEAEKFLVKGRPRYMGGVHEAWSEAWHATLKTAQSIRAGAPQARLDFAGHSDDHIADLLRGLYPTTLAFGRTLAEHFDFAGAASVVDIGGGSGGLLVGLCERHRQLRATLFDLPTVTAFAARMVQEAGLAGRVAIEAGDIVRAPPQGQYDAAILCAVVQILDPQAAALAIRHAVEALTPGGVLYIGGRGIVEDDRLAPAIGVLYNLVFLNLYEQGRSYTQSEYAGWLVDAGCREPQKATLPDGSEVIWARKPAVQRP